jgi:hypothetical protein
MNKKKVYNDNKDRKRYFKSLYGGLIDKVEKS